MTHWQSADTTHYSNNELLENLETLEQLGNELTIEELMAIPETAAERHFKKLISMVSALHIFARTIRKKLTRRRD